MREIVPGVGGKSTADRIRELEEEAGTLPVIFALFFTEGLKQIVIATPIVGFPPGSRLNMLVNAAKMLLAAIIVGGLYVYEEERKEYVQKAKEGVSND